MKIKIMMIGASLEQNGGIATVEKLILKHADKNLDIQHITSHDEGSIKHRLMVFNQALIKLLWRLITQKIDIVYIHLSDGGSLIRKSIIALIGLIFNKPVFIHTHGAEFHVTYSRLPKWAKQCLSSLFRRCNGFIVLSTIWQDFYVTNLGLNPQRVFVLPNPTELPMTVPQRCNIEKVTLLFCGRVGERKGAFDLIKAFANLPYATKNRSELILAGDGDIEQGQELVKSLNLVDNITFLGWVDSKQRDSLLNQADVFILPSYNEGLPMAILEAMGWGLPIISTPVGGIPELVITNKNGWLVTPGNIKQLSQVMQSLVENEELRLSLGKNARETVMPFDVNNYCPQLVNIFNKCTNIAIPL
ncbi:glycosyltransferase family 4 protein [Dolichospermum sp. UHCC 0259]|uniref:glycosyltransferase family 4 protein n=1 Tax=Dolichospermum sp. UHCC 0259 TaxID=2590010 RepID=UPI001445D8CE|nr:glycosyltransferase family 4 protein [Dolichospermum sp. UHCC 0259]MTJ48421.1 glycosyltransferase family 4 protein [Dolichospermum sp. UHCC 0259]